jgi:Galactose oxidase, central domain
MRPAALAARVAAIAAVASLAVWNDAGARQDRPSPVPPEVPPAAYSVGSAYDAGRHRLVVFGGYLKGAYSGDTWEWDGTAWHRSATTGPPARNSPSLVYDEARRQIVLFGGDTRATGPLSDTWVYDGTSWREIATPGPPARTTHQMVYDTRRERVVLFGGSAGTQMFGDTWEWDGRQWSRMATTGPDARTLYGLAYDSARGVVVLFGGTSVLASDAPSFGDTWEWNGARWTAASATGPSPRDHVSMAYDPARRLTIMHGRGTGPDAPGETWAYDGTRWSRLSGTGPRRRFARLDFDIRQRAMLLFGGFDREPSNELWRLRDASWERIAPLP